MQEKDTKYLFLFLEVWLPKKLLLIRCFSKIWTVYLEVVIPRAQHGTVVVDVWNTVIQKISKLPGFDTVSSDGVVCHYHLYTTVFDCTGTPQ